MYPDAFVKEYQRARAARLRRLARRRPRPAPARADVGGEEAAPDVVVLDEPAAEREAAGARS